ncbi:phage tail termination protein [Nocardia asteroides]
MTSPYPTPGEFPDFERFLVDLLSPIETATTTLPATGDQVVAQFPFCWVRQVGGSTDINEITYTAKVRVTAAAADRAGAQALAARARVAILASPGKSVNGVLVDWAEEMTPAEVKYFPPTLLRSQGTADLPNLDPVSQLVELGFSLQARRQS